MTVTVDKFPGNAGFIPRDGEVTLDAHGALVKGTVYEVDFSTASASTGWMPTASKAAAATGGSTAGPGGIILVLALEDVTAAQATAGYRARFLVSGVADAIGGAGLGSGFSAEDAVSLDTDGGLATAIAATKSCGIALEAAAGGALGKVWFDGWCLGGGVKVT
jgi:hypothetical protein